MYDKIFHVLNHVESIFTGSDSDTIIHNLRNLCLDDFGLVMLKMPMTQYPNISSFLPQMASDKVQEKWTGTSGRILLRQSLNFVRILQYQSLEISGSGLRNKQILDYGCGYGRLLRLMYYFTDTSKLFGCDPWDESIRLCQDAGIDCKLDVTEYLPKQLPYDDNSFDIIFSFSVFTHTSIRAAETALNALHRVIKPQGLLAITIRPRHFWNIQHNLSNSVKELLYNKHNNSGFAFLPHNREPVDGDITYGDTSMKIDMIENICPLWQVKSYDRSLDDPYQIIVFLSPRQK